jgi:hypothetical protein
MVVAYDFMFALSREWKLQVNIEKQNHFTFVVYLMALSVARLNNVEW